MIVRENPNSRQILCLLFILTGLMLALGIIGMWPVLGRGCQRLRPWQIPFLWSGDIICLLLFVRFFIIHGVQGKRLHSERLRQCSGMRDWWPALSMLVAFSGDLAFTSYEIYEEYECRENKAQLTDGEILDYSWRKYPAMEGHPAGRSFLVRYHYQDEKRNSYFGTCSTPIAEDGRAVDSFPADVVEGLLAGRKPLPVRVLYDSDRPARNWLADVPRLFEYDQVFLLSMAFLLGQFTILPGFMAAYIASVKQGVLPWWRDLLDVLPLIVEAAVLCLFAVLRFVDAL